MVGKVSRSHRSRISDDDETDEDFEAALAGTDLIPTRQAVLDKRTREQNIKGGSMKNVIHDMRHCLLTIFLVSLCSWLEMDLCEAFLRSTVACPTPIPTSNGECPMGSIFTSSDPLAAVVTRECVRVPRGEPNWSGSKHCMDKNLVVAKGTRFGGRLVSLAEGGKLIGNMLLGSTLVDTMGRKPVMVMALCGSCCLTLMMAIASRLDCEHVAIVLYFASLFVFLTNGFHPASVAMTADLTKADESQRSLGMTVLNVFANGGTLCGFIMGFFLLKMELEDYSTVWTGCFFITLLFIGIIWLTLKETLPSASRNSQGFAAVSRCFSARQRCSVVNDIGRACSLVWSDHYLRSSLIVGSVFWSSGALGTMTIGSGWAISICGYGQAYASLMGILKPIVIIIGSLSTTLIVPKIGPYWASMGGCLLTSFGFALTGFGAFYPALAAPFWWAGSGVISSIGGGITIPCVHGIWSSRVKHEDQGKLFAVSVLVVGVSSTVSSYIFSNILFTNRPEDSSLRLSSAWFVAAFLQLVAFFINIQAYFAHIAPGQKKTRAQRQAWPSTWK